MTKSSKELTVLTIPAPTPQHSASLSQPELVEHRAGICAEVETVLSAYFRPQESEAIKTAQLAWWADELQDWRVEHVVWGLRKWNRENPRARPTPGDIVRLLKAERGRQKAAEASEAAKKAHPPKATIDAETRAQILTERGFGHVVKTFNAGDKK